MVGHVCFSSGVKVLASDFIKNCLVDGEIKAQHDLGKFGGKGNFVHFVGINEINGCD